MGTAGIVAMVVRGAVGGIQPFVGQDLNSTVFSERYGLYISDSIFLTLFFEYDGIPRGQKKKISICEFDMHRASNPVV